MTVDVPRSIRPSGRQTQDYLGEQSRRTRATERGIGRRAEPEPLHTAQLENRWFQRGDRMYDERNPSERVRGPFESTSVAGCMGPRRVEGLGGCWQGYGHV